ncbi:excalibur calcium-binding domain-containing protein [filamentous cyanobacterium LEGE 11480]|uniref:Excalibur calcium-binding domain-containing protein n=1 Tax=Romeriopsis navalis LEGE 11480 TaxID=2777977 RepID=A0A928VNF9_9CYAN|nr:excalibur calcium-binding domain-containing protein [Romeriopsis navalis LEGE 11480]
MRSILAIAAITALLLPAVAIAATNPPFFVEGTCKELNKQGWGNFPEGDPNYTAKRDRDNDGIACEF